MSRERIPGRRNSLYESPAVKQKSSFFRKLKELHCGWVRGKVVPKMRLEGWA